MGVMGVGALCYHGIWQRFPSRHHGFGEICLSQLGALDRGKDSTADLLAYSQVTFSRVAAQGRRLDTDALEPADCGDDGLLCPLHSGISWSAVFQ